MLRFLFFWALTLCLGLAQAQAPITKAEAERLEPGLDRSTARTRILWLIENHPESPTLSTPMARLDPKADDSAYPEADRLWKRITAAPDALIASQTFANAIHFYAAVNRGQAFEILSRARAKYPTDDQLARLEGSLDVLEILGVTATDRFDQAVGFDPKIAESERARRIRQELEQSTDARVLSGAGYTAMRQQFPLAQKGRRDEARRMLDTTRLYFERALKAEPADAQARSGLRLVIQSIAAGEHEPGEKVKYLEQAAALPGTAEEQFNTLVELSKAHLDAGQLDKAETEAKQALEQAPQFANSWNYGNAIHHSNIVLGRIALKRNDVGSAKQYLLAAGRTKGSPQLNSFGPNTTLADELLARGERDTVLEFLRLCGAFWKMDQGRLQTWTESIKKGGTLHLSLNGPPQPPKNMLGRAAPGFRLKGLDGAEHTLQEYAGKVVLLDFWATWCAPCREEMPLLDRIHRENLGKDVEVVGIDAGEDLETVSAFINKQKYSLPILLSGMNEAVAAYRVNAYPTVVVVDKAGKVADYLIGSRSGNTLGDAIAKGRAGAPAPTPAVSIPQQASAEDLYRYAVRFRRERNLDDCVAAMDRAIQLSPDWWQPHMMRGGCYYDLKQFDEAIRNYDEVVHMRPEWAPAYVQRGLSYSYSHRHSRGIEDFDRAIQLVPENAQAFNARGWAYLESGKLDEALADLNQAVKLNPAFQLALENRVNLYIARKEYSKAISDCDALLSLNLNGNFAERRKRDAMRMAGQVAPDASITVVAPPDGPVLTAPQQLTPEPGLVFHTYPRHTVITWEPVSGAVSYAAEVDFQYQGRWASEDGKPPLLVRTTEPRGEFNFVGAQPGRWRVWALDANGTPGTKSEWREFRYTR